MSRKSVSIEGHSVSELVDEDNRNKSDQPKQRLVLIKDSEEYLNRMKNTENLNELFIIENAGLDEINLETKKVESLEKLVLHSNGLTKIPNLTYCRLLQVLWLAENKINKIQGLDHLEFLTELNLSKNCISYIESGLEKNVHLRVLYLSANPIDNIEDISNLFRVQSLRKLYLSDPLYGDCPLAKKLIHYRTQIIHWMPFLQSLDTFPITSNDKDIKGKFMTNYIIGCESLYAHIESKFKCEEQSRLNTYLEEMEMFRLMHMKYNQNLTKEKSKLFESQQKVLFHEIRNWSMRFWEILKELNQRKLLQITQSMIEKECFGNKHLLDLKDPDILQKFNDVFHSFICSSNVGKNLIINIKVNNVTLFNRKNCKHEDNVKEDLKHITLLLLKCPFRVSSITKWNEILSNNFPSLQNESIVLTNCLITCDSEYLQSVKSDFMKNPFREPRIAIIVGLNTKDWHTNDKSMIPNHILASGDRNLCHDWQASPCQCTYFAVEFQYEFKDKYKLLRDESLINKDVPSSSSELGTSISYHLSLASQSLTCVTLSGCNIVDVGNAKVAYPHVVDFDVSYNLLTSVRTVFVLFPNLRRLNASHNSITRLESNSPVDALEDLDISWNSFSSFFVLLRFFPVFLKHLKKLNLKFNPMKDLLDDHCQAQFLKKRLKFLQTVNEMLILQNNYKTLEINDTVCDSELILSLPSTDVKNRLSITKLGLANRIMNGKTPHDVVFIRDDKDATQGVCSKSSALINTITISSSEVQWISVTNNYVSNVNIVHILNNLKELYLSNNHLQKLNVDLNMIPNIVKIDISRNFLENLSSFQRARLKSLTYLNLSENHIKHINDLAHLTSIEQLYLNWNRLGEDLCLLTKIKTLVGLKSIGIIGNPLNNIVNIQNFIINSYPIIEFINGEQITCEDKNIAFKVSNMTLDFAYLLKTYTMSEVASLTQLTLSNVSLKTIELDKNIVPHMESINLERNAIEYFSNLGELPKLKTLRLSHNRIHGLQNNQDLDDSSKTFEKLETLYLDHNEITSLVPFHFDRFVNLKYLFLQANKILDLNGLEAAPQIKILVLDKNEISQIPPTHFMKFKSLIQLYLESNKIQVLHFASKIPGPLQKLFLAHNRIKDFTNLAYLRPLKRLKEITLQGNYISSRPEYYATVIQTLNQLQYLDGHIIEISIDNS